MNACCTLIDRHPKFVEPVDEISSAPDDIRAIFARLAGVGAERFHQWWISDAAALKSAADGLQTDGPDATALRKLIAAVEGWTGQRSAWPRQVTRVADYAAANEARRVAAAGSSTSA